MSRGANDRGATGRRRALGGLAALGLLLAACGHASAAPGGGGPVSVLYAGSLVNLMEHHLGPSFAKASPYSLQGYPGGSSELANEIKGGLRRADVFVSAAPSVDATLTGPTNGAWVRWYATFARAPLVIGYNPNSRFAAELRTRPWYEVMAEPGFRLGRTDPKLDPKGVLTVQLVREAAAHYRRPGLVRQILGSPENPAQVFPEETLVGRLQAGQLDAGFFYSVEAVEAHIPYITLPSALRLSASYTLTIPRDPPNPAGALAFVRFLLGPEGRSILRSQGLQTTAPALSGARSAVPASLRPLLHP